MFITPLTIPKPQSTGWLSVMRAGTVEPVAVFNVTNQVTVADTPAFSPNGVWENEEMRKSYMESCVMQDVAWQIKVNRTERDLSQSEVAAMVGTHQSAISRLENGDYAGYSIPMLLRLAHAFDCALLVKFVSYSKFAEEVKDTSVDGLYAKSFQEEQYLLGAN